MTEAAALGRPPATPYSASAAPPLVTDARQAGDCADSIPRHNGQQAQEANILSLDNVLKSSCRAIELD
jgi:hypothetical protein